MKPERALIYKLTDCVCERCNDKMVMVLHSLWGVMVNEGRWKWLMSSPPHIHHIDGNHHNNIPENMLFVCPPCHTKLHQELRERVKIGNVTRIL